MFTTLQLILSENWHWRHQTWNLAKIDLVKTYRGAALGKLWLFAKPAVYILVFWFALSFGMRSGQDVDGKPFLLWLASGVFPWFFMSDMITTGSDVYRRYPYLVNRIKFPLSLISTFYTLSLMIILICMLAFTMLMSLMYRIPPSVYWLQLPLILALMLLFWTAWSITLSPLSAISRDFANLLKTLGTPFFWLSGILFQLDALPGPIRAIMSFNPVAWGVDAIRCCFIYNCWIWSKPRDLAAFLIVLVIFVLLALNSYRRLSREVPDVL